MICPQAQPSQPAAHNDGYRSLPAGLQAGHTGQEGMLADIRAADLAAAPQYCSASPQQAGGSISMPINLPPSMVRIAAALPPVQQQAMVCPQSPALISSMLPFTAYIMLVKSVLHGFPSP